MMFLSKHNLKSHIAVIAATALFSLPLNAMRNQRNDQSLFEHMDYDKIFDQKHILAKCPHVLKEEGLPTVSSNSQNTGVYNWIKQNISIGDAFHVLSCGYYQKYKKYKAIKNLKKYDAQLKESNNGDSNEAQSLHFRGTQEVLDFDDSDSSQEVCLQENQNIVLANKASEALDKALVEDFLDKKQAAMKATLGSPLFSTGVYAGTMFLISKLSPSETGQGIGAASMGWIIASATERFSRAFWSIYVSPLSDDLKDNERLYAGCKRLLSEDLQKKIQKKFSEARKSPHAMTEANKFSEYALNLPLKSKLLKSPVDCQEDIKDILGYTTSQERTIIDAFYNHYKRFSNKAKPLKSPKTVLYLQGPPGVGKTYLVEKISKILGVKPIKFTVGSNPSEIIGNPGTPGTFLASITKEGSIKNAIIFMDEIDRVLNGNSNLKPVFLQLLNPDSKYFKDPYLKTEIDISHFCFIMAGNHPIEDEATRDRMDIVKLEELDKRIKRKIVDKILKRELGSNKAQYDKDLVKKTDYLAENYKKPSVRDLIRDVYKIIRKWQRREEERRRFPEKAKAEQEICEQVHQRYTLTNETIRDAYLKRIKEKAPLEDKKNQ